MANRGINYYFLLTAAALICWGLVFLATLSSIASLQNFGNTTYYLFHQMVAVAIGLVAALILYFLPIHSIKKMALPLFLANALVVGMVFVPFVGSKFYGAHRWVSLGPVTFQPSEFLKITAIMYLAAFLANRFSAQQKPGWLASAKKQYANTIRVFLPFGCLLGIITLLLALQKDASTLGIVMAALIAMYFAAGTPLWNTFAIILSGIGTAFLLIKIEPYRMQRFLVFLNPDHDVLGSGFQLKQAILALGSGGWFGKGLGMSTQKFGFLPEAMSDSVFAIIGEELGIIGCTLLVLLFVFFFWKIITIAKHNPDTFSRLTAVGICTWILVQTFMNMASSLGIWPLSGIPLPFFSYGGSHVIAEIMAVGLLLNISKNG